LVKGPLLGGTHRGTVFGLLCFPLVPCGSCCLVFCLVTIESAAGFAFDVGCLLGEGNTNFSSFCLPTSALNFTGGMMDSNFFVEVFSPSP
jgi:hypothetical protein